MIFQDFWDNCVFIWKKKLIFIGDMIGTDDSTVVCCLPLKQKEISNPHWRSMGKKSEKMSQGCGSPCIPAVATQKDHGPELPTSVSVCESTPDNMENYNQSRFQADEIHRRYYKRMSFSV